MLIKNTQALTLVEIMISMLIVSFVMVSAFQVLSSVGIGKIRLIESSQIEKEAFFASERLIDLIKKGGTIDYEEYWNRQAIGNIDFTDGYFSNSSAFGNEGTMYYCLSGDGTSMGTGGCLTSFNRTMSSTTPQNYTGAHQPYGQYRLQYIDHNSDANDDFGDVSRSTGFVNFIGDDDDLFLGQGPDTFTLGQDAGELYLINASGDERTFFRWRFGLDSDAPAGSDCTNLGTSKGFTGEGCRGTIEILKLRGVDTSSDGFIDTWYVHPDFTPNNTSNIIAGSVDINIFWQSIFSNRIHVSKADFYLYPNQNLNYAWSDSREDLQVAPYLQLRVTLMPSWKERRKIRGSVPEVNIATTIHLSQVDIF